MGVERPESAGTVVLPDGLGVRGAALWRTVTALWELRPDELELLTETVRTVDVVEALHTIVTADGPTVSVKGEVRTHPALIELRQTRQLLGRLLGQLSLPDETGSVLPSPASARARKAAETRWAGHRKGA